MKIFVGCSSRDIGNPVYNEIADKIGEFIDTINDRKNCYKRCADVLVFIPGGIGTLDEFIDALETRRAGEHLCPILIVNADGLYDGVLDTLYRMYKENLASYGTRELYHAVHTADEAIDFLNHLISE